MSRCAFRTAFFLLLGLGGVASTAAAGPSVRAEPGPGVSPQAFDQQDRICRGQAPAALGDQRITVYVGCMQQFGNVVRGADGRVLASVRPMGEGGGGRPMGPAATDAEQIEAHLDAKAQANLQQAARPGASAAGAAVAEAPSFVPPNVSERADAEYRAGLKTFDSDFLVSSGHFKTALHLGDARAAVPYCEKDVQARPASTEQCLSWALRLAYGREPTTAELQAPLTTLLEKRDAKVEKIQGRFQTASESERRATCLLLAQSEPQPDEAYTACTTVVGRRGSTFQEVKAAVWEINPRNAATSKHFLCETDATRRANKNAVVPVDLVPNPYGARLTTAYLVPLKSGENFACPVVLLDGTRDVVVRPFDKEQFKAAVDSGGILGGLAYDQVRMSCEFNPDGVSGITSDVRPLFVHVHDDNVEYGFGEGSDMLTGKHAGVTYNLSFKTGALTRNGARYGVCRAVRKE